MNSTLRFRIGGMDCPNCSAHIEGAVRSLAEVSSANIDFLSGELRVVAGNAAAVKIISAVQRLGYSAKLIPTATSRNRATYPELVGTPIVGRRRLVEIAIATLLVVCGGLGRAMDPSPFPTIPLIVAGGMLGGWRIALRGVKAALALRLDMNFLMTLAAIGAGIIGDWTEAGVIIVLFTIAEAVEGLTVEHSRKAIRSLMRLTPPTAVVLREGRESLIPCAEVKIGEMILIKPGSAIPLDAGVVEGRSSVNQAVITGEALPVVKEPGGELLAGTINGEGSLLARVTRIAGDTTLDKIVRLVEQARSSRAPVQRLVDRFAAYYTPIVVGSALLAGVIPPLFFNGSWDEWIYRALALLVIACPCALVISTPVTISAALAGAARLGVLIKGGIHLENLRQIRAAAFDKTGTITFGRPSVTDVIPLNGKPAGEILRLASSIELYSEHPIGAAIVKRAKELGLQPDRPTDYQSRPGRGASGKINGQEIFIGNHQMFEEMRFCDGTMHAELETIAHTDRSAIMVGTAAEIEGIIAVADEIRPEAPSVIAALRKLGIVKTALLTGDNRQTATAIGKSAGFDEIYSELMPHDKIARLEAIRKQWGKTLMVGDGVNDAPALAAADIGMAMGGTGSDAALEIADIVLMSGRLDRIPWAIRLSHKTHNLILMNTAFALSTKLVFMVLAATGNATLWMAVFADTGVSLLVIFNGLRALRSD